MLKPRFIPGLTIAADYINISLKNAIISLGGDDILNACFDANPYPSTFCGLVTRGADSQITLIKEGFYNAATREFAGVTAEVAYNFGLDKLGLGSNAGDLALSVNYLYVDKQSSRVGTGDINNRLEAVGNPRHSFTANVNYANGGFRSLVQVQYFGRAKADVNGSPTDYQYPTVSPYAVTNGVDRVPCQRAFRRQLHHRQRLRREAAVLRRRADRQYQHLLLRHSWPLLPGCGGRQVLTGDGRVVMRGCRR